VRLDVLYGACQISLVLRTVSFDPKPRTFGNCLVGVFLVRALFRVFSLPCKVLRLLNQLAMISLNDGTL
jgi:hypothetical protein